MKKHPAIPMIIALLCWATALPVVAQQSAVSPEARAEFIRAGGGDTSATDRTEAAFGRLSAANPDDPVARSYHGAALSQQGRDAWKPWTKMKKVEQGLAEIDKALARIVPEHEQALAERLSPAMETRMTAIGTFIGLPDMFHRLESARALIRQTLAHPGFQAVPREQKARIYAWAAQAAEKSGEKAEAERLNKLARESGWLEARE